MRNPFISGQQIYELMIAPPGTSREERLAGHGELLAVESSQCKVYSQERI
jgi:hypothetical protein